MSKKETYEPLARQYYVESQMPVSGIAKRLNLTEKTIHKWKKDGNWDNERAQFLRAKYSCYGSLYELANLLATKALRQWQTEGTLLDVSTMNFLSKIMDKLPKLKSFENNLAQEHIEQLKGSENTADNINILEQIDKHLRGET